MKYLLNEDFELLNSNWLNSHNKLGFIFHYSYNFTIFSAFFAYLFGESWWDANSLKSTDLTYVLFVFLRLSLFIKFISNTWFLVFLLRYLIFPSKVCAKVFFSVTWFSSVDWGKNKDYWSYFLFFVEFKLFSFV